MKKIIILLIAFSTIQFLNAQNKYSDYLQQGKNFYNKGEFLSALERFDLAYEFAVINVEKTVIKGWKNRSKNKIRKQQQELRQALVLMKKEKSKSDSLRKIAIKQKTFADIEKERANLERQRAEIALKMVKEMQKRMETAVFDRAAKEVIPNWEGSAIELFNANYNEITKLNLSYSGLSRIPSEVYLCENLKSINLIGNELKNWTKVFNDLNRLKKLKEIKISVQELDSMPEKLRAKVTGIKIYSQYLMDLPLDLFHLKSLTYLDLSGKWYKPQQYEARTIVMTETEKRKRSLSSEIANLSQLEVLDLRGNGLTKLPDEISKLKKLKSLLLYDNDFSDGEKQQIKKRLSNCEITF